MIFLCRHVRQRRPDRAVYVPRHRRSLETPEEKRSQNSKTCTRHVAATLSYVDGANTNNNSKLQDTCCSSEDTDGLAFEISQNHNAGITCNEIEHKLSVKPEENASTLSEERETLRFDDHSENDTPPVIRNVGRSESFDEDVETNDSPVRMETMPRPIVEEDRSLIGHLGRDDARDSNGQTIEQNVRSDVLIISDTADKKTIRIEREAPPVLDGLTPPERKVKKVERHKSKPAPPPSPPLKVNRDECDWDSLFDDNGDCLDPTLIEEVSTRCPLEFATSAIQSFSNRYQFA